MSSHFSFLLFLVLTSLCPLRAADPLTEQECHEFGRQFARLCRQDSTIEVGKLIDGAALTDNTLKGLELDEAQKIISREDYENIYQDIWPETLILDHKRTFYYAGTITYENRQCVVIDSAEDINCDLYLIAIARARDGAPRCTDIYNVSDAKWESEVRRNQLLVRLPQEVLRRQPADFLRALKITSAMKTITVLVNEGKRVEALEQLEKIPETLRSQKPVLRAAVILHSSLSEKDKFRAELERWGKHHPQDLSVNFHAYRGYLHLGDDAAATQELQALKNKAGNNPYLQYILSYHYYELGNLREAKIAAAAATTEGTHGDRTTYQWWILLKISAQEKDYQETIRLLNHISNAFPFIPVRKIIDTETDFQEFRQSAEYRQWIAAFLQPAHK